MAARKQQVVRGGRRAGSGRPKRVGEVAITKSQRWAASEWADVERLADRRQLSVSDYLRALVREDAARERGERGKP